MTLEGPAEETGPRKRERMTKCPGPKHQQKHFTNNLSGENRYVGFVVSEVRPILSPNPLGHHGTQHFYTVVSVPPGDPASQRPFPPVPPRAKPTRLHIFASDLCAVPMRRKAKRVKSKGKGGRGRRGRRSEAELIHRFDSIVETRQTGNES